MTIKKWIARSLAAALCLALMAGSVGAYSRVETDAPVSLSLTYRDADRNQAVSGMTLRLYKVYNMTDAVRFLPTEQFQTAYPEFQFNLSGWKAEDGSVRWQDMAASLESLLARDAANPDAVPPTPARTEKTDENGRVTFKSREGDTLTPGLYLVMGGSAALGQYTYTPQTFLVSLPMLQEDDTWLHEVAATGKMSIEYHSPGGGDTTSLSVVKKWMDEDAAKRPASVKVQLLRDGAAYETVTLSGDNDWQHTWNRLDRAYRWQVAEVEVPADYTVSVTQTGSSFVVTNTANAVIPEEPAPGGDKPGTSTGSGTNEGDLPPVEIPDGEVPLGEGGLPKTGVLWWPVQLLTIAGVVLFTAGWAVNRRGKRQGHEE